MSDQPRTPDAMIRVLLADDHAVVRAGLRALINAQPSMIVVGEADDGETAVSQAQALSPDVLVMDLSMPHVTGTQAVARLRAHGSRVRVLALTVHEERGYVTRVMQAGASGYVLKRAAADELIHAIRTVARGGIYVDPSLAANMLDVGATTTLGGDGREHTLSGRELEVLRLIAEGHSNKSIGYALGISSKTVETYKARLMEKLALRSRVDIVRFALRHGLLTTT